MRRWGNAALVVGLAVWQQAATTRAGGPVPYTGTIEGEVTMTWTGGLVAPSAQVTSSHLGKGVQEYDVLVIERTESGLLATGCCRTIAANGDELPIQFYMEGSFTGPETLSYVGRYEIIAGGTGRFDCGPDCADLGEGELAGVAQLIHDFEGQTTTLTFRHRFTGTIRLKSERKAK